MVQFYMPGSEELFDSLIQKEVETNYKLEGLDGEWEKEQEIINVMLGDRAAKRPNGFVHKKNTKPWPISKKLPIPKHLKTIQKAGGLSFCKKIAKIAPKNIPQFILDNPHTGKGYLSTYNDYTMIITHCEDIMI